MTDNNEFRVKQTKRSDLEPSDWLLTPEGKPLRARYMPYTPGDDPQVLQLLGYQPPRPNAPVIRVDRGIQTRGFHAGETMAGKILAAGVDLRSGYPDYFELGTCLSYSTEPGSSAEIDEWTELRLVEDDQVARWVHTQEAYDAQLDERLGIDTDSHAEDFHTGWPDHDGDIWVLDGELNGVTVDEPIRCCPVGNAHGYPAYRCPDGTFVCDCDQIGSWRPAAPGDPQEWPTLDYPRIVVVGGLLDDAQVQFVIADRKTGPDDEVRWEAQNLNGDAVGTFWGGFDRIDDWVREDVTEWPTAKRIQVLAGTIDNERITAPVVAERVDWHENAFSAQECFPKYRIVQGTAPVGATDAFYNNYDSDQITRYAVLEEGDDD